MLTPVNSCLSRVVTAADAGVAEGAGAACSLPLDEAAACARLFDEVIRSEGRGVAATDAEPLIKTMNSLPLLSLSFKREQGTYTPAGDLVENTHLAALAVAGQSAPPAARLARLGSDRRNRKQGRAPAPPGRHCVATPVPPERMPTERFFGAEPAVAST